MRSEPTLLQRPKLTARRGTDQDLKDVNSTAMGVVVELTSLSNSSRRCVRDLSHQANHGYFGQLEAQATRSGLFFVSNKVPASFYIPLNHHFVSMHTVDTLYHLQ